MGLLKSEGTKYHCFQHTVNWLWGSPIPTLPYKLTKPSLCGLLSLWGVYENHSFHALLNWCSNEFSETARFKSIAYHYLFVDFYTSTSRLAQTHFLFSLARCFEANRPASYICKLSVAWKASVFLLNFERHFKNTAVNEFWNWSKETDSLSKVLIDHI